MIILPYKSVRVSASPGWEYLVSVPAVKSTELRFVSCGFAALTLDRRSSDQVRAGYRVRPRCGHAGWPSLAAGCGLLVMVAGQLSKHCPQPQQPQLKRTSRVRTVRASVAAPRSTAR